MDDVSPAGLNRADPGSLGFDANRLAEAVAFAESAETHWPRDLSAGLAAIEKSREPAPWNEALGPSKNRTGPNGLILKNGSIAASWGDTSSVEMTFSAAKSYLSILAGLAVADGLIGSIDDPVRDYAIDAAFDTDQNRDITWRHLLNMTSEFEGSLWDKPDLIDRHRRIGADADNSKKGTHRDLQPPGSFWEYNDVRVNRLSLCLMQVFRRPLPDVLKERIMGPIGASDTWTWHHYRNSFFEIDGVPMASVPGGAHWGGRIVDCFARPCPHGATHRPARRLGRTATDSRKLVRSIEHAMPRQVDLWPVMVAEHRRRAVQQRPGNQLLCAGRGAASCLDRSRPAACRGVPLDRPPQDE